MLTMIRWMLGDRKPARPVGTDFCRGGSISFERKRFHWRVAELESRCMLEGGEWAESDFTGALGRGAGDVYAAPVAVDQANILTVPQSGIQSPSQYAATAPGRSPVDLVAGDFNHDDHLDLATANFGSSNVFVLLGKGNEEFLGLPPIEVGLEPISLTTGDLDGDGNLDIATANSSSNDVSVLWGHGDGTFVL